MKSPLSRRTDPVTSRDASDALDTTVIRGRVLDIHQRIDEWPQYVGGLTDDELMEIYYRTYAHGLSISDFQVGVWGSARKRRSDLKNAGILEDSGLRRPGRSRKQQIVWRVKRETRLPTSLFDL